MRRYLVLLCVAAALAGCGTSKNNARPTATASQDAAGTSKNNARPTATAGEDAAGTLIPTQGNNHVNVGATHQAYTTDPPVSGPHFPIVPRRGIYTAPFVTEYLPHFLEHGGVEVLYNSSASQAVIASLTSIVNAKLDQGAGQVLIAPRPEMPCQVTVSSWQRISAFNGTNCESGWLGQRASPPIDPANTAWKGHAFDPNSSNDRDFVKLWIESNECRYDPENQCGGGVRGTLVMINPAPGEPTVTASLATPTPTPR